MKTKLSICVISTLIFILTSGSNIANAEDPNDEKEETFSWVGDYPMSFFTKTRSSKTVGKNHLSVSLNYQLFDWDLVKGSDGDYHGRTSGQEKKRSITTLCTKYGWAKDHHIAIGIPYWSNNFDTSTKNDSDGFVNVYIFEKWNCIKETNNIPGVSVDLWYYFPNGDADKKLGTEDGAYKITTEISKAWKDFSLHFNPGYTWSEDDDGEVGEINSAILFKPTPTLWPAIEYNYTDKEELGRSHDLVPGFVWAFAKGWTFKAASPINIDSTFTDRDRVGVIFKLFHKW
ncbi:MAG: transporter [Sedimentisphaerales bacterium]|nr:transporter [Sedimentisphaerales bacterium]